MSAICVSKGRRSKRFRRRIFSLNVTGRIMRGNSPCILRCSRIRMTQWGRAVLICDLIDLRNGPRICASKVCWLRRGALRLRRRPFAFNLQLYTSRPAGVTLRNGFNLLRPNPSQMWYLSQSPRLGVRTLGYHTCSAFRVQSNLGGSKCGVFSNRPSRLGKRRARSESTPLSGDDGFISALELAERLEARAAELEYRWLTLGPAPEAQRQRKRLVIGAARRALGLAATLPLLCRWIGRCVSSPTSRRRMTAMAER